MNKSFNLAKLGLNIFFLTSLLAIPVSPIFAFDPTHILSDEEMQNWQCMSKSDVQNFLDFQGGKIASMKIDDGAGKKRPISSIIYDTAKKYQINPKYILVTLQKEQSLLTAKNPTQKQLDWAAGYAICDSCSMDDPALQSHKGLFNQIDSAAGLMRWYYDNVTTKPWIKRPQFEYTIDSTLVRPKSYATAFLYTYTPHIQGNQNFWTLWQKWFEQTYPGGTLLRSTASDVVYLIQNGKKRPITTPGVLSSRFDPKSVIIVAESELGRYDVGPEVKFPNYSILKNGEQYYLLDYDNLRPFANAEVVRQIGYNPEEIIEVAPADIRGYEIGETINLETTDPTGRMVKFASGKIYLVKNGTLFPVPHSIIATKSFPDLKIEKANQADFVSYPIGDEVLLPDGTLFSLRGDKNVYVVDNGAKRLIPDEMTFKNLGYKFSSVITVPAVVANMHRKGLPMSAARLAMVSKSAGSVEVGLAAEKSNVTTLKIEEGKMASVPKNKIVYEGEKKVTLKTDTYLVADYSTGAILAAKNIDVVRPLASLTKIMAAKVMFDNALDLDGVTTYDVGKMRSAHKDLRIVAGEKIVNKDLMDSFLVSSLNSAGPMLVSSVSENEKMFVQKMNDAAMNLGLSNTKFTDSYGYDLGNLATAREYLPIFLAGVNEQKIFEYLSKTDYSFEELLDLDGSPTHFDDNTNLLLKKSNLPYKILASKTGYLNESGANLAMLIERPKDGKRFVLITMGNPDYKNRFNDPDLLARFTIANF